jgi:hypothetical protein
MGRLGEASTRLAHRSPSARRTTQRLAMAMSEVAGAAGVERREAAAGFSATAGARNGRESRERAVGGRRVHEQANRQVGSAARHSPSDLSSSYGKT